MQTLENVQDLLKLAGIKESMHRDKDVGEGNLFTGNLKKAREEGKDKADLDGDGDLETVQKEGVLMPTRSREQWQRPEDKPTIQRPNRRLNLRDLGIDEPEKFGPNPDRGAKSVDVPAYIRKARGEDFPAKLGENQPTTLQLKAQAEANKGRFGSQSPDIGITTGSPSDSDDISGGSAIYGTIPSTSMKGAAKPGYTAPDSNAVGVMHNLLAPKDQTMKNESRTKNVYSESQQLDECGMSDGSMSPMGSMAHDMEKSEGRLNISSNYDSESGRKSLTVTAEGDQAEELAQMLKLSGMMGGTGMDSEHPRSMNIVGSMDAEGAEDLAKMLRHSGLQEAYANEPHPKMMTLDQMLHSGNDLHKEKESYPKAEDGDNPRAVKKDKVKESLEQRLWAEFQHEKTK